MRRRRRRRREGAHQSTWMFRGRAARPLGGWGTGWQPQGTQQGLPHCGGGIATLQQHLWVPILALQQRRTMVTGQAKWWRYCPLFCSAVERTKNLCSPPTCPVAERAEVYEYSQESNLHMLDGRTRGQGSEEPAATFMKLPSESSTFCYTVSS